MMYVGGWGCHPTWSCPTNVDFLRLSSAPMVTVIRLFAPVDLRLLLSH